MRTKKKQVLAETIAGTNSGTASQAQDHASSVLRGGYVGYDEDTLTEECIWLDPGKEDEKREIVTCYLRCRRAADGHTSHRDAADGHISKEIPTTRRSSSSSTVLRENRASLNGTADAHAITENHAATIGTADCHAKRSTADGHTPRSSPPPS
jgi:hypothetical protein